MSDNYAEETKPLFKTLRTEAFRFVIVRYNHFSLVQQLEKDLQARFPDRPFVKINAQNANYQAITKAYFALESGFFFIENFDDVLKEQLDSQQKETPEFKIENERRRGISAGLNLRRDKLAKVPVAIFIFVPATADELYAKIIMEKMPDLWSFRSLMLDLEKERVATNPTHHTQNTPIADHTSKEKNSTELKRLLALLEQTPKEEIAYRLTLYPQIADEAIDTGKYELAFSILDEWEQQTKMEEKGVIWRKKGDILTIFGNLEAAMSEFEKAKIVAEKINDDNELALAYERIGNTQSSLGNLEQALFYFEEYNHLERKLHQDNPDDTTFKNNLAVSYQFLGETQSSLGNLEQALMFYNESNRLGKELYEAYPNNVDFKNGLAISYEKLGNIQSSLGNLEQALEFYNDYNRLEKELYEAYPNNVAFKNGLAISYSKLGNIQSSLGNLEQALVFYNELNRLEKELYEAYPNNVDFKNGLAVSYEKLGSTQSSLGNLEQALVFFNERNRLGKELYETYPNNVAFKNGLAISYYKLGQINLSLQDNISAKTYLQQAETLWEGLVRDAPQYAEFRNFLDIVQEILKDLD